MSELVHASLTLELTPFQGSAFHPGGVEIVASCHGNRDTFWNNGPQGSNTELTANEVLKALIFTNIMLNLSALLIANWTATVGNTTTTSITIHWQNLMPVINRPVLHYISLLKKSNGSDVSNAVVVNGNTTYAYIAGLSTYTEYQVSVVGVSSDGQPYTSSNVTTWTEEGGNSSFLLLKIRDRYKHIEVPCIVSLTTIWS